MPRSFKNSYYTVLTILFLCLSLFIACEPDASKETTENGKEISTSEIALPSAPAKDLAFYTAWMADCTSDTLFYHDNHPLDSLTKLGQLKLTAALKNDTMKSYYGYWGDAPSWGPALNISTKEDYAWIDASMTNNLLYAAQFTFEDLVYFRIGVAGTNMVSPYGWLVEDFDTGNHVSWYPDGSTKAKGMIAQGSSKGLDILTNLSDQSGLTILAYLDKELKALPKGIDAHIMVSGHSLGGALAPLLGLYLKERLKGNFTVSTWAFAGPTPGNKEFTDYMVQTIGAENYNAYNNERDVVAHVWQQSSIEQICNLYADIDNTACPKKYGSKIIGGPIVQGFGAWAMHQGTTGGFAYHMAGPPTTFAPKSMLPVDPEICQKLEKSFSNLKGDNVRYVYDYLTKIASKCKGVDPDKAVREYLLYMAELGYQHTYPYMQEFIPSDLIPIVSRLATAGSGTTDEEEYFEVYTLAQLSENIVHYLDAMKEVKCGCSDQ